MTVKILLVINNVNVKWLIKFPFFFPSKILRAKFILLSLMCSQNTLLTPALICKFTEGTEKNLTHVKDN